MKKEKVYYICIAYVYLKDVEPDEIVITSSKKKAMKFYDKYDAFRVIDYLKENFKFKFGNFYVIESDLL